MKALLLALALPVFAGPSGETSLSPATGFPAAYLGSLSMALDEDERYPTLFLDSLLLHIKTANSMTEPKAVSDYLEFSATDGHLEALQAKLGVEPLPAPRAAALLLANALARDGQAREILIRLESLKPGLGRRSVLLLEDLNPSPDPVYQKRPAFARLFDVRPEPRPSASYLLRRSRRPPP